MGWHAYGHHASALPPYRRSATRAQAARVNRGGPRLIRTCRHSGSRAGRSSSAPVRRVRTVT